ncbi:MAG: endonuclease MutS2 [Anaerorhabdus sp.]
MNDFKGLEFDIIKKQIADICFFNIGSKKILELQPSFNPLVITRENQKIKEALLLTIKYGEIPFIGASDISGILNSSKKGIVLSAQDFIRISKLISCVKGIFNYKKNIEEDIEQLSDLISSLIYHDELFNILANTFNDEGFIYDHASVKLNQIRNEKNILDQQIQKETAVFINNNISSLTDNFITTINDRCVCLVRISEKNKFGGIIHGESASGQSAYIEPSSFIKFNNYKQELKVKENLEIERICTEISKKVEEIADELASNLETIGELDALFAKAIWGKKQEATVAEIVKDRKLMILKARHPLIAIEDAVLNTYRILNNKNLLLITGSNTGGKTVSLKCIGLAVIMAYSGIPICCEEATLPFFDNVFVDIGDEQSVTQSLSTFSSHLSKIAHITNRATANSLVLLDEIGAGTDPKEGECIAIAILDKLKEINSMVVATTHYGKLKLYGKNNDDVLLASVQFDIEKMRPTYKYVENITGNSNAFDIALKFGIDKSIIDHAKKIKENDKVEEEHLLEKLEEQKIEQEKINDQLNILLNEEKEKIIKINNLKDKILKEKNQIIEQAQEQANKIIENAQIKTENIINELKNKSDDLKLHEILKLKKEVDDLELTDSLNDNFDINVGDFVELIHSNQVAEVIKVEKNKITINLNGKTVHTNISKLRSSNKKLNKKKSKLMVKSHKVTDFSGEINLIGFRVEEALNILSKYIDDALYYNYPQVRIIHGDGSGKLRQAVHKFLKEVKSVKSYRLGMPQEGSTGVTIVSFTGDL